MGTQPQLRLARIHRLRSVSSTRPSDWSSRPYAIGDSIITHGFKSGGGMRMKKGSMYGRRYAAEFRAELYELFLQGERRQSDKLGPGGMLEILQQHHPDRYNLPSENEIRQEIAKFWISVKPRAPTSIVPSSSSEQSLVRPRAADAFFESLLDRDSTTKSKHALAVYRSTYNEGGLSDSQLKAKFSSLKNRRKQTLNVS